VSRLARFGFWLALAAVFILASLPEPPKVEMGDKIQHMLAFAILTALAVLGYRTKPFAWIALGLGAFGALIELVQAIPMLNRSSEWADWVADMAAVLVVGSLIRGLQSLRAPAKQA
jgi:VanZ family protein